MLNITVPRWEDWDPKSEKFIQGAQTDLTLEHSLVSISKWEAKWHKPFLSTKEKTQEEMLDYIRCMTLQNRKNKIPESVFRHLTEKNMKEILDYIGTQMTATTINHRDNGSGKNKIMTSEQIYYYMVAAGIPFECQYWHLSRLMVLIEIYGIENQPKKKMSRRETAAQYKALNDARRAKHHSRG